MQDFDLMQEIYKSVKKNKQNREQEKAEELLQFVI